MNVKGPARCRQIVIIGGGFSGAAVALNLLHMLPPDAAEITVVEPRPLLGAGLAYSAPDPAHRVNVAAVRLLVLPDEPGAFDTWLRQSGALDGDPKAFLPDGRAYPNRAVFGRYVDSRLREKATCPAAPPFTHSQTRAIRVERRGAGYEILLDQGGTLAADVVVLAVSHPPPGPPAALRHLAATPKFFADPWSSDIGRNIAPLDRVLIIGTALSTADAVATLDASGHQGEIVAISRRGLVSRQRRVAQPDLFGDFTTHPNRSALALLRQVRATIRDAESGVSCWEAVIDTLRAQGTDIWSALPALEQARLLRHLRPFWDVHRYQLAPQLGAVMTAKTATGQLSITAARIVEAAAVEGRFQVQLRERGATAARTEWFDAIVNCTGPDHGNVLRTNPALASLAQAGMLRADVHQLGIETDLAARVIDDNGRPNATLLVAGPLARAAFGELMGLPQVSMHAALVAEQVAEQVSARVAA